MQPNSSSEADAGDFPSSPFDPDLASSDKGRCRVLSRSQSKPSVDRPRARVRSPSINLLRTRMRPATSSVDRYQQPSRPPNGNLHQSRLSAVTSSRPTIYTRCRQSQRSWVRLRSRGRPPPRPPDGIRLSHRPFNHRRRLPCIRFLRRYSTCIRCRLHIRSLRRYLVRSRCRRLHRPCVRSELR